MFALVKVYLANEAYIKHEAEAKPLIYFPPNIHPI